MSQLSFDYEHLIDRLNKENRKLEQEMHWLFMDKFKLERQLDNLLIDVHQVFGEHPNFDELVDKGHYQDWTGAGIVRN